MSPQLASTLLFVLMACGSPGVVTSEAATSRLTGHFAYVSGSERDDIAIYITIRSEADGKFSLGLMAAHPDAHGAAPDGGGEGRIEHDGIFRFSYEDSFFNKRHGTFRRAKDGYLLSIDIKDVQDSRCLAYYGKHTLQRNPRHKHPRGLTRRWNQPLAARCLAFR